MTTPENPRSGIFPGQWIVHAIDEKIIVSDAPINADQIQPNSLDLRLGEVAYRVNCSFLPGVEHLDKKLARFKWYDLPVSESGTVLERNQVYLFPLRESLNLPDDISARANPKSTTGRLDVFTRLVTETGSLFDDVPAGYQGRLYLEVVPRSFAIIVRPNDTLAQIRFQTGSPQLADEETADLINSDAIIVAPDQLPMRASKLRIDNGVFLTVKLREKGDGTVGFRARKNQAPIDLRGIGRAVIRRYWDRIYAEQSQAVILDPDEFYIFASRELVRLPPDVCAEMVPFDAGSGELRTHYAGFFDSGFGYTGPGDHGAAAAAVVLEIRNRDVPYLIEEGTPLFRLILLRNTEPPSKLYGAQAGSNYQTQRLRLSKQFRMADDDEPTPGAQAHLDL